MEPLKHKTCHTFLIAVSIKKEKTRWSSEESIEELKETV